MRILGGLGVRIVVVNQNAEINRRARIIVVICHTGNELVVSGIDFVVAHDHSDKVIDIRLDGGVGIAGALNNDLWRTCRFAVAVSIYPVPGVQHRCRLRAAGQVGIIVVVEVRPQRAALPGVPADDGDGAFLGVKVLVNDIVSDIVRAGARVFIRVGGR